MAISILDKRKQKDDLKTSYLQNQYPLDSGACCKWMGRLGKELIRHTQTYIVHRTSILQAIKLRTGQDSGQTSVKILSSSIG